MNIFGNNPHTAKFSGLFAADSENLEIQKTANFHRVAQNHRSPVIVKKEAYSCPIVFVRFACRKYKSKLKRIKYFCSEQHNQNNLIENDNDLIKLLGGRIILSLDQK